MASSALPPLYHNLNLLFRPGTTHPVLILVRLVLGYFGLSRVVLPEPLPSPRALRERSDLIYQRYDGITMLRQVPLFHRQDTSTASLYRMCEFLCANNSNQLMGEMQYFWDHPSPVVWALHEIPDPQDEDVERYAILASIVESLVLAFNWRLEHGFRRVKMRGNSISDVVETCPYWTSKATVGYLAVCFAMLRLLDSFGQSLGFVGVGVGMSSAHFRAAGRALVCL